jgi:hypothetical protein
MKVIKYIWLVLRLRMHGAIPPILSRLLGVKFILYVYQNFFIVVDYVLKKGFKYAGAGHFGSCVTCDLLVAFMNVNEDKDKPDIACMCCNVSADSLRPSVRHLVCKWQASEHGLPRLRFT